MRNMNMKKYIALILMITVLCMGVMPGAAFADTTSASAETEQAESAEDADKDAEAQAKAEEEAKKRLEEWGECI